MAKQSGVAPTTLKNWSARTNTPLACVVGPNGDAMYTWRLLLDFCRANPNLQATPQVLAQYRTRFAVDPASRSTQPPSLEATETAQGLPSTDLARDGVTLRSAVQELRTQVAKHSALVSAAAQFAEDTARAQQSLLSGLALLDIAVAATPNATEEYGR